MTAPEDKATGSGRPSSSNDASDSVRAWVWRYIFSPALRPFELWLSEAWIRTVLVAWTIAAAAVVLRFASHASAGWLLLIAAGWVAGSGILVLISSRRRRTRPGVLVAKFTAIGDVGQAAADVLQDDVVQEVERRLKRVFGSHGSAVETTPYAVNVGSNVDKNRVKADAADRGYAVAVAANVKQANDLRRMRWAIVPAARSARQFEIQGGEKEWEAQAPEAALREYQQVTVSEVGTLAQLAVGLVLWASGQRQDAQKALLAVQPPNYTSLFYAAYVSLQLREFGRAAELAQQAASLEKRRAALCLLAFALSQTGEVDRGVEVFASISGPDVLPDIPAVDPSDDVLAALPQFAIGSLIAQITMRQLRLTVDIDAEIQRTAAASADKWAREDWRIDAQMALKARKDPGKACALLARHVKWLEEDPWASAIYAWALGSLGEKATAAGWAARSEQGLPAPTVDTSPWQDLVCAYYAIGDIAASERCLAKILPYLDHRERSFIAAYVQYSPEIVELIAGAPEPSNPDLLPGRARKLADDALDYAGFANQALSGEESHKWRTEGTSLASRAERALAMTGFDPKAWQQLIDAYAQYGDVDAVARCLIQIAGRIDESELKQLLDRPSVSAISGDIRQRLTRLLEPTQG